jgi:hypothetical protein
MPGIHRLSDFATRLSCMAMHELIATYLVAHECHFKMLLPPTLLLTYRTNAYKILLLAAVSAIYIRVTPRTVSSARVMHN